MKQLDGILSSYSNEPRLYFNQRELGFSDCDRLSEEDVNKYEGKRVIEIIDDGNVYHVIAIMVLGTT